MKKILFECDLENGPERFNVVGLDLDEVLALMLRQINFVYSSLLESPGSREGCADGADYSYA